jgi:hypothetical protein
MILLGSWAGSLYVSPDSKMVGPITSRHFLCDACQIPLRVEYCPAHQKRLIVPPLPSQGIRRPRPHRCPSLGCTYEKSRDEGSQPVGLTFPGEGAGSRRS